MRLQRWTVPALALSIMAGCGGGASSRDSVSALARRVSLLQEQVQELNTRASAPVPEPLWILWRRSYIPSTTAGAVYAPPVLTLDSRWTALAASSDHGGCIVRADGLIAQSGWAAYVVTRDPWEVRPPGHAVSLVCLPQPTRPQ